MDTRNSNLGLTDYFIGIDQHKHYSMVAVIDPVGTKLIEERLYHNDKDGLRKFFSQFPPAFTQIALEATGFWYWLYDLLESLHLAVKLAHPLKVKLIAESTIKTDKIDAYVLANLLRTGYLPTSYIPSADIRNHRELLRHRIVLVYQRTSLKNRIESVLSKLGINKEVCNLYSKEGKIWLRGLNLNDPYQLEINNYLEIIETLTGMVVGLDKQIKKYLVKDDRAKYLMSIPGIGEYTAYLILAEIGEIDRFNSAKKLASYAGLVPSVNQSGQHMYFGRITKQGDTYLRYGLVESSHVTVRFDEGFGKRYALLKSKKGSAIAITAIARELIEIVYYVLKGKRNYYRRYQSVRRLEAIKATE
jgi:transposase